MIVAPPRTRLIGRLHALKREQGLDDDTYRAKLALITGGKTSAADLSDSELQLACQRFNPAAHGRTSSRLPVTPQARLIQALWISGWNLGIIRDNSDAALMAFIKRQTGLDAAAWLKHPDQVKKVAEALKDMLARDGGVEWSHRKAAAPWQKLAVVKVAEAQWRKLAAVKALPCNNLLEFATRTMPGLGDPTTWSSPPWTKVTRALGVKVRAALENKRVIR